MSRERRLEVEDSINEDVKKLLKIENEIVDKIISSYENDVVKLESGYIEDLTHSNFAEALNKYGITEKAIVDTTVNSFDDVEFILDIYSKYESITYNEDNKIHNLKIKEKWYKEIVSGNKKFEYRKNDRNYKVNDILLLTLTTEKGNRTKTILPVIVTSILTSEDFENLGEYVIMSIEVLDVGVK